MMLIRIEMSSPYFIWCNAWNCKVPLGNVLFLLLLSQNLCGLLIPLKFCLADDVLRDLLLDSFVNFVHIFQKWGRPHLKHGPGTF